MRKSGRWMVLVDDRILEILQNESFQTPSEIASNEEIPYSAQHIGNRCRTLAEHGLVENVGNGVYRITERGEGYLQGTVSTKEDDGHGESQSTDKTPESEESGVSP